jgi:hypothetical protein
MRTFPEGSTDVFDSKSVSTQIFGNRFRSDQTLYEYLIEFLLVFSSPKSIDMEEGRMRFHTNEIEMSYYCEPRMALRRFIFYDKSRKNGAIKVDEMAYQEMIKILVNKMQNIEQEKAKEIIEALQDLYHGYAVVIKKRSWCAQAMMPICPEVIFCGAMPNEKKRKNSVDWTIDKEKVDTSFDFTKRNFLSRGGEIYYLHILQGLKKADKKREKLEYLLTDILSVQNKKMSQMAGFIQDSWQNSMDFDLSNLTQELKLSAIPADGYFDCADNTIDELINFLSNEMHPIKRIELLAKGVMLQIMRMMTYRISNYLEIERKYWIVDMRASSGDTVKKIASGSFRAIEEDFMTALNKTVNLMNVPTDEIMKKVNDGKKHSLDIFRTKGKELNCIIPASGPFERFTLSEDVIRFLVLALVIPQEKMTLDMFLRKLYENYNIIIGPKEYKESISVENKLEVSLANSFNNNLYAFQKFLKATGFLRELSDATSIVINPYTSIFEGRES